MRDEAWFEALYRAHHAAVLAYARRRVDDADDVVAEVFATAWKQRARLIEPPLPWLLGIAHNHVQHAWRSAGRRARLARRAIELVDDADDTGDPAARIVHAHDASAAVLTALAVLRPDDQEILRLSAWEDLDPTDIARVLGCSSSTARVRLHRARRRLEEALTLDLERQP